MFLKFGDSTCRTDTDSGYKLIFFDIVERYFSLLSFYVIYDLFYIHTFSQFQSKVYEILGLARHTYHWLDWK